MIEFKDVNLKIGKKVILQNINLQIPDNCQTVILGKSGCGKTMLMKTLEGLYRVQSGSINIDGTEITKDDMHERSEVLDKIAMVFQYAALLDSFTVFQNIALPLYEKKKLTELEIRNEVQDVLKFLGLESTADMFPSELSGGMRKRIGLARALVTNPKYLILDEPTTGLDPFTAEEVMSFLKLVINNKNVVPITITHDPYCIAELGEFIVMMDEGKILFSGFKCDLEKLAGTPEHKFYSSFFLQV